MRAAAEELPHGGPPLRSVCIRVEAVLALAGDGADVLRREALAVPITQGGKGDVQPADSQKPRDGER